MNRTVTLPGTGISVSPLCLGGNRLGGDLDKDQSFALLDAFVSHGGNFIDTAHEYANWLPDVERSCSEKTLGRWLRARGNGDTVTIATKIGHPASGKLRLDAASLRQDVAEALENLQLDRLDIVYLHRDDPSRDAAEILSTMEELCKEGLIRHYASSNWTAARLSEATELARKNGWQGFVANQSEWSLALRNPGSAAADLRAMDTAMIDWHRKNNIAAVPYSSQARGYFDKLAKNSVDAVVARNYESPANRDRGERLNRFASRHGVTPTQAMLALFQLAPFPVIPVVGSRTTDQIAASFAGANLALDPNETKTLMADLGLGSGT